MRPTLEQELAKLRMESLANAKNQHVIGTKIKTVKARLKRRQPRPGNR